MLAGAALAGFVGWSLPALAQGGCELKIGSMGPMSGGAAQWGLAMDGANNLYVLASPYDTNIVKYTPAGIPSNFAGRPYGGYFYNEGDGMAFDSAGNLYVADFFAGKVRKFDSAGNGTLFAGGLNGPTAIAIWRSGTSVVHSVLTILRSGTNAVISWPLAASNDTLQSNTNLAGTNWVAVPGTPGTNGSDLVLTNGLSGSARYYRLKGN